MNKLLASDGKITLSSKDLPETNTLAYFRGIIVEEKKFVDVSTLSTVSRMADSFHFLSVAISSLSSLKMLFSFCFASSCCFIKFICRRKAAYAWLKDSQRPYSPPSPASPQCFGPEGVNQRFLEFGFLHKIESPLPQKMNFMNILFMPFYDNKLPWGHIYEGYVFHQPNVLKQKII